jgi:hypothetical protein
MRGADSAGWLPGGLPRDVKGSSGSTMMRSPSAPPSGVPSTEGRHATACTEYPMENGVHGQVDERREAHHQPESPQRLARSAQGALVIDDCWQTDRDAGQVLIESVPLSLVGGLLGAALGHGITMLAGQAFEPGTPSLPSAS